jgi:triacylglycerol lipase
MYYPPTFDSKKALELGNLVVQAYKQFQFFKSGQEWKILQDYNLVQVISYNRWQMGFDSPDEGPTLIDKEMAEVTTEAVVEQGPVSFGIVDEITKEYPMGFIATSKTGKNAYLIFRGTVTPQEFVKDAKIKMQPYFGWKNWGNVALGFFEVYMACRESFMKTLAGLDPSMNLFIGGHSLGAALSVLSLPDVIKSTPFKKPVLYNFGCPRVGDNAFVTSYNAQPSQKTFRIANSSDIVASVPLPLPMPFVPSGYYSHVNTPVEFNVQKDDIGLNHSMDTYVAALS